MNPQREHETRQQRNPQLSRAVETNEKREKKKKNKENALPAMGEQSEERNLKIRSEMQRKRRGEEKEMEMAVEVTYE